MAAAFISMGTAAADTDLDPFEDALGPNATPVQLLDATTADTALATLNPTLAGQLDAAVDAGSLPTGTATDADAFSDLGLPNGATLDAEFPTLAQQLDPGVDQLVPPPVDNDPFVDLAQAFDPTGFNSAGAPVDFIATFATELDAALASIPGLNAGLDPIADSIINFFDPGAMF